MKISKSIKNIILFLDFFNFYQKFIKNFSKKVKCFIALIKNKQY